MPVPVSLPGAPRRPDIENQVDRLRPILAHILPSTPTTAPCKHAGPAAPGSVFFTIFTTVTIGEIACKYTAYTDFGQSFFGSVEGCNMDYLRSLPRRFPLRPLLAAIALLAGSCPLLAAAAPDTRLVATGPGPSEVVFPSIETPNIKPGRAPTVDLRALPKGAQVSLPNQDMGHVFMRVPPTEVVTLSGAEVADKVIVPLLSALHFDGGMRRLRRAPEAGLPQTRPQLDGVAQLLALEYQGNEKATRPRTLDMVDAFLGKRAPTDDVERNLLIARGLTYAQYKADIERQEIIYPFMQVDGDVPIEHTLLLASRWEGQSVTSVRGSLIHRYSIANLRPQSADGADLRAYAALSKVRGIDSVDGKRVLDGPSLVLLPYGNDSAGAVSLRYAWRMVVDAISFGRPVPFRVWSDAATGTILKMRPLVSDVTATGNVWRRDPGTGATQVRSFTVDPAVGGQYTLKLAGVVSRVDHQGDGFDAEDVSISSTLGGSSATLANFNQAPINNGASAICASGANPRFQQVNYFGVFHVNWKQSLAHGIYTPFPTSPWNPRIESASAGCNAWSSMNFGACQGYFDAACPNYSDGTTSPTNFMNFAHDNTVVGHELAHNAVQRFTDARPANWCGMAPCAIPVGMSKMHDLADAWADHVDNTNCTAGWAAKNLGGVNASNNCQGSRGHSEGGSLPRLHEVTTPFNPAIPGDHFPEHRDLSSIDYADMQIGSAILWQVREGMRSKCRPSGHPQYFVRFTRALKNAGFAGSPGDGDRGIYNVLHDLELEMVEQWATSGLPGGPPAFAHNGNHTTNKVLAGFAKGGIFAMPSACIDGDPGTADAAICPSGENGGDAVIDMNDNDPADDLVVDGISHRETDFLKLGGPAPTFQVWTGPRFRFTGTGARPVSGTAICNAKYIVEASTDQAFSPASTINSGWRVVDLNTATPASPECSDTWTPNAAQWTTLQSGGHLTRVYYRTRTRDALDGNERISTSPGAGLWTVPPPYAVITTTGGSDY
ncbi:hypothetical protein BN2497_7369 [Janthinobacterium sp. CG23_2]|nr:hypothetical protein BN2497_7369 [Janthinobacterium sp. CG23_2]CUU30082.1 hypothetical protein BN3177_7369 [Janthinobacterium sp. CG23_2]